MTYVDTRSDGDDCSSTLRMNSMEYFKSYAMKGYAPFLLLHLIEDILLLNHSV